VGSSSIIQKSLDPYILGLWGADGYHRTSSIGLTAIYSELIKRFYSFLRETFPLEKLRLRVYTNNGEPIPIPSAMNWYQGKVTFAKGTKLSSQAWQLYVNSRPLLRHFRNRLKKRLSLPKSSIIPYIAGRFDGDGSVAKNLKNDFRITYCNRHEAEIDQQLLNQFGFKHINIYQYQKAGTHVIYVSTQESLPLGNRLRPYSAKLSNILVTP
jgi:intein/homing endonuclease